MDAALWFVQYREDAERTDQLAGKSKHIELLAAGLFGETGGILAELKKRSREDAAYPADEERLVEEVGDFLWYFARLTTVLESFDVTKLDAAAADAERPDDDLADALALGAAVGALLDTLQRGANRDASPWLEAIWRALVRVAAGSNIRLEHAAEKNLEKTRSRWPREPEPVPLFDDEYPEWEQIPRRLKVEFREMGSVEKPVVILRCNGLNLGDRLTDNIGVSDGYRFHDVFHFAHAVHLGWSPLLRSLLKCKRKSNREVDESEDGARARIIEEAVSATVFSRAKEVDYYGGIDRVDYDLLKTIQGFVKGFEVDRVPLWQWEEAILNGYRVFRELCKHKGGVVTLDLVERKLAYEAPGMARGRSG